MYINGACVCTVQTQFVALNLYFMCAVSWKTITDALRRLEAAEAANVTFATTTFGSGKIEQKEDAQKEERHVDSDALFVGAAVYVEPRSE